MPYYINHKIVTNKNLRIYFDALNFYGIIWQYDSYYEYEHMTQFVFYRSHGSDNMIKITYDKIKKLWRSEMRNVNVQDEYVERLTLEGKIISSDSRYIDWIIESPILDDILEPSFGNFDTCVSPFCPDRRAQHKLLNPRSLDYNGEHENEKFMQYPEVKNALDDDSNDSDDSDDIYRISEKFNK
jgi:hypothetical protein